MVVTASIERAIQYYYAISNYLEKRKIQYKAIVAFSGEHEFGGEKLTEATINGFPSNRIEKNFKKESYCFLIVVNRFQAGYDELLIHTMYVDDILTDIKAVQTLSRLNRAHPQKHDTFVLDFANEVDEIQAAFSRYYRTTILTDKTDPNKLYDLQTDMEGYQVYSDYHVETIVELYLNGADRDKLDPILDVCVKDYNDLDEDGQVNFKSKAKAFVRTYNFLASILPYGNAEWEKLSIFLNLLIPKLPSAEEEDLSKGILEAIDLDSYRVEAQATMAILLNDADAEVAPVPTAINTGKPEPELDLLSNILATFHELFGNIQWKDEDQVQKHIATIPEVVAKDKAYRNAVMNSDKQNARLESEKALNRAIINMMADNMEVFKQFQDNPSFKKWLSDMVFNITYEDIQKYEKVAETKGTYKVSG